MRNGQKQRRTSGSEPEPRRSHPSTHTHEARDSSPGNGGAHSKRRTSKDEEGVEDEAAAAGASSAAGEWNMNSLGGRPEGNARIWIEACWKMELQKPRGNAETGTRLCAALHPGGRVLGHLRLLRELGWKGIRPRALARLDQVPGGLVHFELSGCWA